MSFRLDLPGGTAGRPVVPGDAEAVVELIADSERRTLGRALIDADDLLADWRRPSFDLATDAVGVESAGRLVGYADVYGERADVHVRPSPDAPDIGAWLLAWAEDRARAHGAARVGATVAGSDTDAITAMRLRGYQRLWTSWLLRLPVEVAPPPRHVAGYGIRPIRGGQEHAAYQVVEDAFNEWPDRTPTPYGDWAGRTVAREGFEPWQLQVALDASGAVVGTASLTLSADGTGWVEQLAVAAAHRGRGNGAALVTAGFDELRRRGAASCKLSTDSRTGALDVYLHLGMVVDHEFERWSVVLQ